jgi:hypothetical protein
MLKKIVLGVASMIKKTKRLSEIAIVLILKSMLFIANIFYSIYFDLYLI